MGRTTKQTHSPDEQDTHLPPGPSQMQEHPREINREDKDEQIALVVVILHKSVLKIRTKSKMNDLYTL